MDLEKTKLVNMIITDFETTYVYFLLEKNFQDGPVVQAAFYAACEKMVNTGTPHPDPMVQSAVLEHLRIRKSEAIKSYLGDVERLFIGTATSERRRVY